MGFREVFGIEFASDLVEIAKRNIEIVGLSHVATVLADATDYKFPPGDLVIYMFNPFGPEVMQPVVANLARTIVARPADESYVVYTSPACRAILDEEPCLEPLGHPPGRNNILVWKSRS
jgi:predicted RNA methylase